MEGQTFAALFKKYRLRSEFENLSDFGHALAQKGLHYEDSYFSHWQKGTKIPRDRHLLLITIKIFVERGGIGSLREANSLLEAADQGYLTDAEITSMPKALVPQTPFQAPRQIDNFTGRAAYLREAVKILKKGLPLLIHAAAGMGKSSTAIRLAHQLREEFIDGILWYRLDTTTPESILNAIAFTYGKDIANIQNIYNKASFVRSLLSEKKVLLVFDNLEHGFPLDLILPSSGTNACIVTSRYADVAEQFSLTALPLYTFDEKETNTLFTDILGQKYVNKNNKALAEIGTLLGHLPLAVHLIAKQLARPYQRVEKILKSLKEHKLELKSLIYADKNLLTSLELAYSSLPPVNKKVFPTLGVFEGTDFALEAVAYINDLSEDETTKIMDELISASLVEYSAENRYRLHPAIAIFTESKITNLCIYAKAADYYAHYLNKLKMSNIRFYYDIEPEKDNILKIIKKCYKCKFFDSIIRLWDYFGRFLWNTGRWQEAEEFGLIVYNASVEVGNFPLQVMCCVRELSWTYFWKGEVEISRKYTHEALTIAKKINDSYLIAYAKERLGKVYQGDSSQFHKVSDWLNDALTYFIKISDHARISNTYRYYGEAYILIGEVDKGQQYLEKALDENELSSDNFIKTIYKAIISTHLGALALKKKRYDKALLYFSNTANLDNHTHVRSTGMIWNNIGLGLVHEYQGNLIKAQEFFRKAKEATLFFDLGENIEKRHIFSALFHTELINSKFYTYLTNHELATKDASA